MLLAVELALWETDGPRPEEASLLARGLLGTIRVGGERLAVDKGLSNVREGQAWTLGRGLSLHSGALDPNHHPECELDFLGPADRARPGLAVFTFRVTLALTDDGDLAGHRADRAATFLRELAASWISLRPPSCAFVVPQAERRYVRAEEVPDLARPADPPRSPQHRVPQRPRRRGQGVVGAPGQPDRHREGAVACDERRGPRAGWQHLVVQHGHTEPLRREGEERGGVVPRRQEATS